MDSDEPLEPLSAAALQEIEALADALGPSASGTLRYFDPY
jgi:hypothetical protein